MRFFKKLKNFFVPKGGLKGILRSFRYMGHKIGRSKDKKHKIAIGMGIGTAISFTPLPGFHVWTTVILCLIFSGNIVIALLATLLGNPWTFPLMWYLSYRVGLLFTGFHPNNEINFITAFDDFFSAFINLDGDLFIKKVYPVWLPTMIGGLIVAFIVYFFTHYFTVRFIDKYKKKRLKLINKQKLKYLKRVRKYRT